MKHLKKKWEFEEFKDIDDKIPFTNSEGELYLLGYEDMKGRECECGGTYTETSQMDDLMGVIHCDTCNKEINRCT